LLRRPPLLFVLKSCSSPIIKWATQYLRFSQNIGNYQKRLFSLYLRKGLFSFIGIINWWYKLKFVGSARLATKSQITLPKTVRDILQLDKGDDLVFVQDDNGLIFITKEIEISYPKE